MFLSYNCQAYQNHVQVNERKHVTQVYGKFGTGFLLLKVAHDTSLENFEPGSN